MPRWITRQWESMRKTPLEKPLYLENTTSSVLSVLLLIYENTLPWVLNEKTESNSRYVEFQLKFRSWEKRRVKRDGLVGVGRRGERREGLREMDGSSGSERW